MGWDSNPRTRCRVGGFQDRCLKPLGHPSAPAAGAPQAVLSAAPPQATRHCARPWASVSPVNGTTAAAICNRSELSHRVSLMTPALSRRPRRRPRIHDLLRPYGEEVAHGRPQPVLRPAFGQTRRPIMTMGGRNPARASGRRALHSPSAPVRHEPLGLGRALRLCRGGCARLCARLRGPPGRSIVHSHHHGGERRHRRHRSLLHRRPASWLDLAHRSGSDPARRARPRYLGRRPAATRARAVTDPVHPPRHPDLPTRPARPALCRPADRRHGARSRTPIEPAACSTSISA